MHIQANKGRIFVDSRPTEQWTFTHTKNEKIVQYFLFWFFVSQLCVCMWFSVRRIRHNSRWRQWHRRQITAIATAVTLKNFRLASKLISQCISWWKSAAKHTGFFFSKKKSNTKPSFCFQKIHSLISMISHGLFVTVCGQSTKQKSFFAVFFLFTVISELIFWCFVVCCLQKCEINYHDFGWINSINRIFAWDRERVRVKEKQTSVLMKKNEWNKRKNHKRNIKINCWPVKMTFIPTFRLTFGSIYLFIFLFV